jgi:hypothetical protein
VLDCSELKTETLRLDNRARSSDSTFVANELGLRLGLFENRLVSYPEFAWRFEPQGLPLWSRNEDLP